MPKAIKSKPTSIILSPSTRINIHLIGDPGTGKHAFIQKYFTGEFSEGFLENRAGLTGDNVTRSRQDKIEVQGQDVTLNMGLDSRSDLAKGVTVRGQRYADAMIVMCDVTNSESFENIKAWIREAQHRARESIPFFIVATKTDLADKRQVNLASLNQLVQDYGLAGVYELSNKTQTVTAIVHAIAAQALNAKLEVDINPGMINKKGEQPKIEQETTQPLVFKNKSVLKSFILKILHKTKLSKLVDIKSKPKPKVDADVFLAAMKIVKLYEDKIKEARLTEKETVKEVVRKLNVTLEEKVELKEALKLLKDNPLSGLSNKALAKLNSALPSDKTARNNEITRAAQNREFLEQATKHFEDLKKMLSREFKRNDKNNAEQISKDIIKLQLKINNLMIDKHEDIKEKAKEVAQKVIYEDNVEKKAKLDAIEVISLNLNTNTKITAKELNDISTKIKIHLLYHHNEEVREKANVIMKKIQEIRTEHLKPAIDDKLSIYESLKVHKEWEAFYTFENPKFGRFKGECGTTGFYVFSPKEEENKNDIKMHISIDSTQAIKAMEIINALANSKDFSNLVYEYKIGDIEHLNNAITTKTQSAKDKISKFLNVINQQEDVEVLFKALMESPEKAKAIIQKFKSQVLDDKKDMVESTLSQIMVNEIESIISAQRILDNALFTVYFKEKIEPDNLKKFCNEVNARLKEAGIKNGNITKTDEGINPYCGITIDHIQNEKGEKVYLDSGNPVDVIKRKTALHENPITKGLILSSKGPNTPLPPPSAL